MVVDYPSALELDVSWLANRSLEFNFLALFNRARWRLRASGGKASTNNSS